MKLQRELYFFNNKMNISIIYTNDKFNSGDTEIAVYDKYKISILISNGINAVIKDSIIGGNKTDILFFRPDELHFGRFSESKNYAYLDIFIPITFFDDFVSNSYDINFLTDTSKNRKNCIRLDIEKQKLLNKLTSEIIEYLKNDNTSYNMKLFSLVLQTILLCNDSYDDEKTKSADYTLPDKILKIMRYISQNFNEKLSVSELAQISHCSVTYLSRIFKQYTGMTLYNYITAIRIANAQILLKENLSVTEVCFMCGFNDCSNFINKFKKITGETPFKFQNKTLNNFSNRQ